MSTVNFNSDNSVQGTITTITATPLGINLYAYNTSLSNLSSYSYLSINNLNSTTTTIFNNLNSLSTNSILSINGHTTQISNLNATSTTIFNNLNSLSTNSILSINSHTTQISNLNATSTTIFNNLNSLSTNSTLSINNLNATSITIFNNLNSLSTNSILSINGHTTSINNLNSTSTTIFNNLNSLSTNSILSINNSNVTTTTIFNYLNSLSTNSILSINNLNATSTTYLGLINGHTTSINNLNATSTTIFANLTTSNSVFITAINNLGATSTTTFNNLNSLSTNSILSINNLNNKTNFTNLLVSNSSTLLSSLNVSGTTTLSNNTIISGNVGIGVSPSSRLHIYEASGTVATPDLGSIIIDHDNSGGASTITFRSKVNRGSDYGYIQYQDSATVNGAGESAKLIIGTQNDADDDIALLPAGGVGVNTTTLSGYKLNVNGTSYFNGNSTVNGNLFLKNGTWHQSMDNVFRIWFDTNGPTYYSCGTTTDNHIFYNSLYATTFKILSNGNIQATGTCTATTFSGSGASLTSIPFTALTGTAPYLKLDGTNTMTGGLKFNNLVQNKVISLYDVATPNNFQFTGLGTSGGLILNVPTSTDNFIFNAGATTTTSTEVMRIYGNGNVNIGTTGQLYKLYVNGTTYFNGASTVIGTLTATTFSGSGASLTSIPYSSLTGVPTNYVLKAGDTMSGDLTINKTSPIFIVSSTDENQHATILLGTPFQNVGAYKCAIIAEAQSAWSKSKLHFCLNNVDDNTRGTQNASLANSRVNIDYNGNMNVSGRTYCNGGLNIQVNSWVYDTNGSQRFFFGGGGRSYYQGYGQYTTDIQHEWRNHVGTGIMFLSYTGSLLLSGEIIPTMTSIANAGTDYCGVSFNSSQGTSYQSSIKIMFGTFTGFHRCFTDDIEYNQEDPQKFKDDYIGRIVISSGKIATDTKTENAKEWTILYDKEGISIEDALPIIQLSRTKKDKKVFGVLGMATRSNSRAERMIVNSLGEGGIWVCNSNGSIENGDYITSSDYLGYGEKQDDDLLHNYTVAKATIDCNFELDSPYYNCLELDHNIKIAFIACTYHCG